MSKLPLGIVSISVACVMAIAVTLVVVFTRDTTTAESVARQWVKDNNQIITGKISQAVIPEIGVTGRDVLGPHLTFLISDSLVWTYGPTRSLTSDLFETTATASVHLDDVLPISGVPDTVKFYIHVTAPVRLMVDQDLRNVSDWRLESSDIIVSTNLNTLLIPEDLSEALDAECIAMAKRSNHLASSALELLLKTKDKRTRTETIQLNAALSAAGLSEICTSNVR